MVVALAQCSSVGMLYNAVTSHLGDNMRTFLRVTTVTLLEPVVFHRCLVGYRCCSWVRLRSQLYSTNVSPHFLPSNQVHTRLLSRFDDQLGQGRKVGMLDAMHSSFEFVREHARAV
jgi:hypothetical protein